jgi:serine/threonine protein kinase/predicted ATPase
VETVGPGGKYQLLRKLAAGGMAEVHLARQSGAGGFERLVVVKRILPHLATSDRMVRRFLDEARLAASLRHPNVIDVFEIVEEHGDYFLAMEYLDGPNLRRVQQRAIEREVDVPAPFAAAVIAAAARGLDHAHKRTDMRGKPLGLVHRDVSPQNIVLTWDGQSKIVDFGIAKAADVEEDKPGTVVGKLSYMSPEQVQALPIGPASDQFSLAIILWELLAGRRLFERLSESATVRAIAAAEVRPLSEYREGLGDALAGIVARALARDPADRFADCGALAAALDPIASGGRPEEISRAFLDDLFPAPEREKVEIPDIEDGPTAVLEGHHTGTVAAVTLPLSPLPREGAAFVGRESDLKAIAALFDAGERLVTLLGPAGAGKSRLALHHARTLPPGTAVFCDLSEARDAAAIAAALGSAIGVPVGTGGEDLADRVGASLATRGEVLVVLDDFEHLIPHAPMLERWLAAAPSARFLVTSQERLHLGGERVHEIGALGLPEKGCAGGEEESVRLFLERARQQRPGWEPDAEQLGTVAEIVRRLDGLPLAIELAAARMAVLTPEKLLERLEHRFELLGRGEGRGTLRGAIEWSWHLLDPHEQSALAEASVFQGGFSLESAEAVLRGSEGQVIDRLQSLRERSLLKVEELPGMHGEQRFQLYESVREFASDRLEADGRRKTLERRHADHFVALGKELSAGVYRKGGALALKRLAAEHANLHAIASRFESDDPALALDALVALEPMLLTRGPFEPYVERLEAILARCGAVDRAKVAGAVLALGRSRRLGGLLDAPARDFERAREIAREIHDDALEGMADTELAILQRVHGRAHEARESFHRAMPKLRSGGDRHAEAVALGNFGLTLQIEGRHGEAENVLARALESLVPIGDQRFEAIFRGYLAVSMHELGSFSEAAHAYRDALASARELSDRRFEGLFSGGLAWLVQETGDRRVAARHYREALHILKQVHVPLFEALVLGRAGMLALERGGNEEARAALSHAVHAVEKDGDPRVSAMLGAALSVALARLGRVKEAQECLADAETAPVIDPATPIVVRLLGGHIELARGHRDAAAARMVDRDPTAILDGRSSDIRYARRLLAASLDAQARSA